MSQEIQYIKISDLHLWTENPRDPIDVKSSDIDIIKKAIENSNNKWNLPKLAKEMGDYYDFSELPTVVIIENEFVVYDGNRRIAVIKYLQNMDAFSELDKGLFLDEQPEELINLVTIPCNVCDIETALTNIERKHTQGGTWKMLERDYFLHFHRKEPKSMFLALEEETGIISKYPKMNQRFVKDEILTKENLQKIGFHYDRNKGFTCNYSKSDSQNILKKINDVVSSKEISTRTNRGKLLNPLIDKFPELKYVIRQFDPNKPIFSLDEVEQEEIQKKLRRSSKTKEVGIFGKQLILKKGRVNDLYLAISHIYEKNSEDETIMPVIGMSLRLLLETAARVHYEDIGDTTANADKIYDQFLKKAKGEMEVSQQMKNFLSLTKGWLDKSNNLEAILGKFAHGNIITSKSDVLLSSVVIADILEFYFKR